MAEPHRLALGTLLEGILTRKGFLVLCGPIGTGKTMLMHSALHLLEENPNVKGKLKTAFIVNPTLSREEFLEAVLDEYEVSCASASKPRRLAALHEMLLASQRQGGTTVLIVDEAHLLTPELLEEIRLLTNTDTYQEKLLQVVLSGQPELQGHLNRPNMRALQQRIAATCQLRPLSLLETRVYVMERLHAAGLRDSSPFGTAVLERVFTHTGGVPRLINLVCDNALAIGFAQHKQTLDHAIIEEAAGKLNLLAEQIEDAPQAGGSQFARTARHENSGLQENRGKQERMLEAAEEDIRTAVDLLINAMKQNRALARE